MRELISKIIESISKICTQTASFSRRKSICRLQKYTEEKKKLRKEKEVVSSLKLRSMLKNRTQRFYTGNLYHIVLYIFRTFPAI